MSTITQDWNDVQREVQEKMKAKPADDVKKKIVIPNPVPAGNRLAHFIRSIHWNSKGMLPSTAGSKRSYDKYNTVTNLSYQGPVGFQILPGEASGGFERKRETIEDIMLDPRKNQMFNRWRVPERIMTSAASEPRKLPTPATPMPAQSLPATPFGQPDVPNIKLKTPVRMESRNGLQQSPARTPKPASGRPLGSARKPVQLQRSKTMCVDTRKKNIQVDENGIPLNFALRPEAVPQAEEWMKHADKADKQVIERILRMASKKNQLDNSMRQTLLPDARDTVEKWMKGASEDGGISEQERQVALSFFNSLAGGQLMGMTVDSKRKRLKEVINTLEETKPGVPNGFKYQKNRRRKEVISDGNLKYIRLLTPDTRENRWMHTTWHHLPQYKDDNPVANWSSHYIRPHEPTPRHFVIHPDWG